MPVGALLGIGMAASGVGSALGASAANSSHLVNNPAPVPLYPGLQGSYLSLLSGLMSGKGGPAGTPGGTLSSMMATGNPTDVGPAFQALVKAQQPLVQQGQQSITNQFAGSGLAYSTPLMSALGNYQSRVGNDFLSILADYTRQASEAAANRQLSATEFGMGAISGPALTNYQAQIPVVGGQSVLGSGLNSAGSGLSTLAIMKALGLLG